MTITKEIVCVIPARLQSSRFPKKILTNLLNKPLLQWVWEAANRIKHFNAVVFAIDSLETAELIESFGGKYLMTSAECKTGTDRLIEVMKSQKLDGDVWVNWQGDEPFITPTMIGELLQSVEFDNADLWTLKKKIMNHDEINSIHFAKVVCDKNGFATYFSRSPIPLYRDFVLSNIEEQKKIDRIYYKHVGIYAFSKVALTKISEMSPCYIEEAEQLEQLRFLFNGLKIRVHQTSQEVIGIDLPEHLIKAEEYAKNLVI